MFDNKKICLLDLVLILWGFWNIKKAWLVDKFLCLINADRKAVLSGPLPNSSGANEDVLSSTSSFTHVTGLTGQNVDDVLLSPGSSADHSTTTFVTPSPKTPYSLPNTSHNEQRLNGIPPSNEITPTNIPLPPEEEDELATPKSSLHSNDSFTPRSSHHSNETLTPSNHMVVGAHSPQVGDILEAFFNPASSTQLQVTVDVSITWSLAVFVVLIYS